MLMNISRGLKRFSSIPGGFSSETRGFPCQRYEFFSFVSLISFYSDALARLEKKQTIYIYKKKEQGKKNGREIEMDKNREKEVEKK